MPGPAEVEVLVGQVVPAIGAAIGTYGAGVLTRAEDEAAEATVRLGQRLLARVLHRSSNPAPVKGAVEDLAAAPEDADALGALRLQIRKALLGDTELAAELAALLPARAEVTGDHSAAVAGNLSISTTGANAPAAFSIESVTYQGPSVPGQQG